VLAKPMLQTKIISQAQVVERLDNRCL
jgi:hypothetical protein